MNDLNKKFVPIILDKARNVYFNWNAFCKMEEKMNCGSVEILEKLSGSVGIRDLTIFLWGGLIHEDKSLSLDDVGEMLNFDDIEEYGKKISEAIEKALPAKIKGKTKED